MYLETTLDLERRRDNHDNDLAACCKTQPEAAYAMRSSSS